MKLDPLTKLIGTLATDITRSLREEMLSQAVFTEWEKGNINSSVNMLVTLKRKYTSHAEFLKQLEDMLVVVDTKNLVQTVRNFRSEYGDSLESMTSPCRVPNGALTPHRPCPQQKRDFKTALLKMSHSLQPKDLEILKALSPLPDGRKDGIHVGYKLFEALQLYGCISENDVELLDDLFTHIELQKPCDLLRDYQTKYPAVHYNNPPPSAPYRHVSEPGQAPQHTLPRQHSYPPYYTFHPSCRPAQETASHISPFPGASPRPPDLYHRLGYRDSTYPRQSNSPPIIAHPNTEEHSSVSIPPSHSPPPAATRGGRDSNLSTTSLQSEHSDVRPPPKNPTYIQPFQRQTSPATPVSTAATSFPSTTSSLNQATPTCTTTATHSIQSPPPHRPAITSHTPFHQPASSSHTRLHLPPSSSHTQLHQPAITSHTPFYQPPSTSHTQLHQPPSTSHTQLHQPASSSSHQPPSSSHTPLHSSSSEQCSAATFPEAQSCQSQGDRTGMVSLPVRPLQAPPAEAAGGTASPHTATSSYGYGRQSHSLPSGRDKMLGKHSREMDQVPQLEPSKKVMFGSEEAVDLHRLEPRTVFTQRNIRYALGSQQDDTLQSINQPVSSHEPASQPRTSVSQPGALATQPGMSASQPGTPATQPRSSVSQPGSLASQPGTSTSQPRTSASQTGTSATQPGTSALTHSTNQPSSQQSCGTSELIREPDSLSLTPFSTPTCQCQSSSSSAFVSGTSVSPFGSHSSRGSSCSYLTNPPNSASSQLVSQNTSYGSFPSPFPSQSQSVHSGWSSHDPSTQSLVQRQLFLQEHSNSFAPISEEESHDQERESSGDSSDDNPSPSPPRKRSREVASSDASSSNGEEEAGEQSDIKRPRTEEHNRPSGLTSRIASAFQSLPLISRFYKDKSKDKDDSDSDHFVDAREH